MVAPCNDNETNVSPEYHDLTMTENSENQDSLYAENGTSEDEPSSENPENENELFADNSEIEDSPDAKDSVEEIVTLVSDYELLGKKYPLLRCFLGVLMHTTAWD